MPDSERIHGGLVSAWFICYNFSMTFTVTYRMADGGIRKEVVEANSRSGVFSQMKSKGIVPLSVKEGGRIVSSDRAHNVISRSWLKGLAAGVLVVFVALGIWQFTSKQTESDPSPVKHSPSKTSVNPIAVKKVVAVPPAVSGEKPSAKIDSTHAIKSKPDLKVDTPSPGDEIQGAETNKPHVLTPQEMLEEAKRRMKFKTAEEQLLSMVTPDEPGGEVPPVPIAEDEEDTAATAKGVANILKPEKDDDEHILQRKIDISEMKMEYAELKKQGWTFAQYVRALAAKRGEDAADMAEARRVIEDLYKDSTVSDAEYAVAKRQINESLAEKGLPPVKATSETDERQKDDGDEKPSQADPDKQVDSDKQADPDKQSDSGNKASSNEQLPTKEKNEKDEENEM